MSLRTIAVHNRQRTIVVDLASLRHFAVGVLPSCAAEGGCGLTNLEEVNVVLVSDRKISELHRRFMQIAGPTDVITFQHGEIFISVETALRQATAYGTTLQHELRLYLVHGLLHLHGFNDHEPAARREMQRLQERIVARASS